MEQRRSRKTYSCTTDAMVRRQFASRNDQIAQPRTAGLAAGSAGCCSVKQTKVKGATRRKKKRVRRKKITIKIKKSNDKSQLET
jgi:hypothetical protein